MATRQDRINGLIGELGVKAPVLVATTAAIALSGTQTIDGIAVAEGDRVLVKNQADTTANGIYYCQASTWVRAPDFDGARDCVQGTLIFVYSGTTNGGTLWKLTTTDPVIGTSNLTFSVLSSLTPSAFIQTLLDDTTAAAARTTLGAAALAGLSTQDFATKNLTAAGTLGVTGNTTLSGTLGVTGLLTPGQITGIKGTTTNNDANAGSVGEVISSEVLVGSALTLVTFTDKNITSIVLTPGDWYVYGKVFISMAAATSVTQVQGSISLQSAIVDELYKYALYWSAFVPGVANFGLGVPARRIQVAASTTTTVYLIARAGFTSTAPAAYGRIEARRVR